jgi:hypothetical protein
MSSAHIWPVPCTQVYIIRTGAVEPQPTQAYAATSAMPRRVHDEHFTGFRIAEPALSHAMTSHI